MPVLTTVKVVEGDMGYYLEGIRSGERLAMRFDTPSQALRYATEGYLVMSFEESDIGAIISKNKA